DPYRRVTLLEGRRRAQWYPPSSVSLSHIGTPARLIHLGTGIFVRELMAFTDSRLARISVNAALVAASAATTLFVIEVSLRLASNGQFESRYLFWRQATYEGFLYHYASKPVEQPPKNFHAVRGWTDFSIRQGPDGYLIEDVFGFPWRETQHVPYAKTRR